MYENKDNPYKTPKVNLTNSDWSAIYHILNKEYNKIGKKEREEAKEKHLFLKNLKKKIGYEGLNCRKYGTDIS